MSLALMVRMQPQIREGTSRWQLGIGLRRFEVEKVHLMTGKVKQGSDSPSDVCDEDTPKASQSAQSALALGRFMFGFCPSPRYIGLCGVRRL